MPGSSRPEARQPRELPGDLLGEHPDAADGPRGGAGDRAREAAADPGGELEPDAEPGADAGRLGLRLVVADPPDPGSGSSASSPERHRVQAATAGQVVYVAVEPTTSPKWPARSASS